MNILEEFKKSVIHHVVTGKYEVMQDGRLQLRNGFKIKNNKNIPLKWDCVRIKDVAKLIAGGTPKSTDRSFYTESGDGYDWIQVCDINNSILDKTKKQVNEKGKFFTKTVPENSVVLAMKASVGKVAKINDPKEINEATLGITPKNTLERNWIFESLLSQEKETQNLGRGGTQNNTNARICQNICIPWPPPEEAARILAFLEKFEASLPNVSEALELLEAWRKSLVYHVVTGKYEVTKDGKCAQRKINNWQKTRLQDISSIENGYPFNASQFKTEGKYPVIRQGDVENIKTQLFTNEETPAPKINKGDMLICQSGEFKMTLWQGDLGLLNQRLAVIKSKNKLLRFILPIELNKIQNSKTPTTIMNLSVGELRKIHIPIPPPEEADRILSFLEKLENYTDQIKSGWMPEAEAEEPEESDKITA